jgi:putative heme-binding domain-containing protein
VLDEASLLVANADLPVEARLSAIELLGYGSFEKARQPLIAQLDPRQPREIQLAAVRCLAGFPQPEVTSTVLVPWSTYTPALRSEVVELLLARSDRIVPVLDAIADGKILPSQLSSARLAFLLGHPNPQIKARAEMLLSASAPGPRQEVIAGYRSALSLSGDRLRGKAVFERECIGCHRSEEKGHDIGPHLATIRHRSSEEVMVQILDPNREVAPNFVQYLIETDDGRVDAGVFADETATSVTFKLAENVREEILRRNIESITSTGKSLMPEGLEQKIQVQEMADLLRYLLGPR